MKMQKMEIYTTIIDQMERHFLRDISLPGLSWEWKSLSEFPNCCEDFSGFHQIVDNFMKYKKFVLKDYPSATFPEDLSCFELITADTNDLTIVEGQAIVKVMWITSDPLLRTWISGAKSYVDAVKPGVGIPGFGVGKVVKVLQKQGKKTQLEPDDWVFGMLQWSQYMKCGNSTIQKLPMDIGQESYKFLTVYGPSGFTSFLSIKREIEPFKIMDPKTGLPKAKEDLNIVISSAAGGIGLATAQYLSKLGYKNIFGIASSQQKCEAAIKAGCRGAIAYKKFYDNEDIRSKEFETAVREMMGGESIDLYYENVGEDMLSSMLNLMSDNGKVIMCGATATYNNWGSKEGVSNFQNIISKRLLLKGIIYFQENASDRVKAFMEMVSIEIEGNEIMIQGIEHLPETYKQMIHGKFIGKPLIQLWPDVTAPCDNDF